MKSRPEVSVIIVSYNTCDQTLECIRSVIKYSKSENIEIIIVDNDSHDHSATKISNSFPRVKLIINKTNVGFGAANNQAMKIAKGNYFLLLNSDTLFTENSIAKIRSYLQDTVDASIVGCKLLNSDSTLQPSCGYFPTLWRLFLWAAFFDDVPVIKSLIKPYHQSESVWYAKEHQVDWVTGAFMFIRAEVFRSTSGFDEKMFMYAEEIEWQMRTNKRQFKTLYTPTTQIIHRKMLSSKDNSHLPFISEFKGLQYIYHKHAEQWQQFLLSVILKFAAGLRWSAYSIIPGRKLQKEIYARALEQI